MSLERPQQVFAGVRRPENQQTELEQRQTPLLQIKALDGNRGVEIEGKRFKRVHIHIGDALGFAALDSLAKRDTAVIVIDPHASIAANIIQELQQGDLSFGFLGDGEAAKAFHSVANEVNTDSSLWHTIRESYTARWEKANANIGNLFLVEAEVENAPLPQAIADKVTYHYPSRYDPLKYPYLFAMNILKRNGKLEVVTDLVEVAGRLRILAYKFGNNTFTHREVHRSAKTADGEIPYFSIYEMIYGQQEEYLVTITHDGQTPELLKPNPIFRAVRRTAARIKGY